MSVEAKHSKSTVQQKEKKPFVFLGQKHASKTGEVLSLSKDTPQISNIEPFGSKLDLPYFTPPTDIDAAKNKSRSTRYVMSTKRLKNGGLLQTSDPKVRTDD